MLILSLCDVEEITQILGIVRIIVIALKIAAPILLMISAMITLMGCIKSGNDDELAKAKKGLINKAIAAVLIFFIPTLVDIIIRVAGGETDYKKCFDINESSSYVVNLKERL